MRIKAPAKALCGNGEKENEKNYFFQKRLFN